MEAQILSALKSQNSYNEKNTTVNAFSTKFSQKGARNKIKNRGAVLSILRIGITGESHISMFSGANKTEHVQETADLRFFKKNRQLPNIFKSEKIPLVDKEYNNRLSEVEADVFSWLFHFRGVATK